MSILDTLKKIFPKPKIPQKRYILVIAMIIYAGLKVYVDHTETEWDNKALETGKGIILDYFAEEDAKDNSPVDQNEPAFGERA